MLYLDILFFLTLLMFLSGFAVTGFAYSSKAPLRHLTWLFPFSAFVPMAIFFLADSIQIPSIVAFCIASLGLLYSAVLAAHEKSLGTGLACFLHSTFAFLYAIFVNAHP